MIRLAVFGNPVGHSRSPHIHRAFAAQCGLEVDYRAIEAPRDAFAEALTVFVSGGGVGANVTVPFKEEAFRLCSELSSRASRAQAVNTLQWKGGSWFGDNTDGAGLIRDISENLHWQIADKRVAVLGAGGAVRGILAPLLACKPHSVFIANRTLEKAEMLAEAFRPEGEVRAGAFSELAGYAPHMVINATSSGLQGELPALPAAMIGSDTVAYDMVYGKGETVFCKWARERGARACADGLGMLVEQAAESFFLWTGKHPDTQPVLTDLRAALS